MKKALTMQQMEVLTKLGVSTEKANRGFERSLIPKEDLTEYSLNVKPGHPDYGWSDWKPTKFYRKWENNPRVQSVPSFNIENMIEILPNVVEVNFTLTMGVMRDGVWFAKYHSALNAEADNLLDALYELYLMCAEQKVLDNGKERR